MTEMQNKSDIDKCLTCPAYENICEAQPDEACKTFHGKLETLKQQQHDKGFTAGQEQYKWEQTQK